MRGKLGQHLLGGQRLGHQARDGVVLCRVLFGELDKLPDGGVRLDRLAIRLKHGVGEVGTIDASSGCLAGR